MFGMRGGSGVWGGLCAGSVDVDGVVVCVVRAWSDRRGLRAEQDGCQLHQQRHQLADLSRGQPARVRPRLPAARARRSLAREAARRSGIPSRNIQRGPQRRQRLEPAGSGADQYGLQLSRRYLSSARQATCLIWARTPGDFRAPTGSGLGTTPARASPISERRGRRPVKLPAAGGTAWRGNIAP